MCPSCIPVLPVLAGSLAGGSVLVGLKGLLASLVGNCQVGSTPSARTKEKNTCLLNLMQAPQSSHAGSGSKPVRSCSPAKNSSLASTTQLPPRGAPCRGYESRRTTSSMGPKAKSRWPIYLQTAASSSFDTSCSRRVGARAAWAARSLPTISTALVSTSNSTTSRWLPSRERRMPKLTHSRKEWAGNFAGSLPTRTTSTMTITFPAR